MNININNISFDRQKLALSGKRYALYTLGCRLNFSESSTMGQLLTEKGATKANDKEVPDICIVNTCSVTQMADKKCRSLIRKLRRDYPYTIIAVTGCYAELKGDEIIKMPGVSIVAGAGKKNEIANLIIQFMDGSLNDQPKLFNQKRSALHHFDEGCSSDDRTRHFLKVQDGCDYFCSYCTIPLARGRSRNGSISSMIEQVNRVVDQGGKEIVLTGVNIGDFGKSTGETFEQLLTALCEVKGIERYRIGSIEPELLTDRIIHMVNNYEQLMPHFHIPLQSGSDSVLSLMRRHYDTQLFRERIKLIKRLMPDAFIGVDVITGMQGETIELFQEGYDFIESLPITQLHVFPYSKRPNTSALKIKPEVADQDKKKRVFALTQLSDIKHSDFCQSMDGNTRTVLWERNEHNGLMFGYTDNYIRLAKPYCAELVGTIERVTIGNYNLKKDYCVINESTNECE